MRPFVRLSSPEFLKTRWESWGEEWEERRRTNPSASFHWHMVDGEAVNHRLLPRLKEQTREHCSFCDAFPVSPPSIDTIEHFRPKTAFPRVAYQWENLYFCCAHCQRKGDDFDEALLRPDDPEFEFDRYFRWDFTRGTLEINELASEADRRRAQVTIDLYRLNEGHPQYRKLQLRNLSLTGRPVVPIEHFPYRSYLEGAPG